MLRRSTRRFAPVTYDFVHERSNAGVGRAHAVLVDRARGARMHCTKTDREYLDFTAGIGVCNLGHCHPRLVKVVQQQADTLWHLQVCHGYSAPLAQLVSKLEKVLPPGLNNFTFVTTGAEAVEAALKLARASTGRQNVVALQGGYHGRTVGAQSMTSSKASYHKGLRPLMPGVTFVPVPYTTQCRVAADTPMDELVARCLQMAEDSIRQTTDPSEVAMMIVEPVMGEGGYVPLPFAYYAGLQKLCKTHGILFVVDEIQTGFYRTGDFLALRHYKGLPPPDAVIFAKGLANGLPLAGLATRKELADKCIPGQQGGTYAGNVVACAAANEVIDIMSEPGFMEGVAARADRMLTGLKGIATRNPRARVQEVRGRGLMLGMEFAPVPAGTAAAVVKACYEKGLLLLNTGLYETIRVIPPVNVADAEIDEGLKILEDAIAQVAATLPERNATLSSKPCCATACPGGVCRWITREA